MGVAGLDGVIRTDLNLVVILRTTRWHAKSFKNNEIETSTQRKSQLHPAPSGIQPLTAWLDNITPANQLNRYTWSEVFLKFSTVTV
jgi:hypothetical protein